MHRKKLFRFWGGFVIVFALVACALPISGSSAKNPNAIQTSVQSTLRAVLRQTEQAVISTSTAIVPTKPQSSAPVISSYGTSLTVREDGSTEFIDHRAGVQILFPANWLALRVGEPEYYEAWEKKGAANPHLLEAITSIQNLDLDRFRVTAYDINPEHVLYDNLPKINVVFAQNDTRTLRQVEYEERTAKSPLSGYKFLSSKLQETSAGLPILVIQRQWKSSDGGKSYVSLYKGVLFQVPTGLVAIDLFIPADQKEILWPAYDQIVDSLTLFTP